MTTSTAEPVVDPYKPPDAELVAPPVSEATMPQPEWVRHTSKNERSDALTIHLMGVFMGVLGVLIFWLMKRKTSDFVDQHGKDAMNFQITAILAIFASIPLMLVLVGFVLLLVVIVLMYVFPIIAAVKANKGELYRYPLTIRFLS